MYLIYENIAALFGVTVALLCVSIGNPAMVIICLFALAVVSVIVMLTARIVRAVFNKSSDKASSLNEEVKSEIQTKDKIGGCVINRSSNEWIADIPAYVRKHHGFCYPLTNDDMKPRFTIKVKS